MDSYSAKKEQILLKFKFTDSHQPKRLKIIFFIFTKKLHGLVMFVNFVVKNFRHVPAFLAMFNLHIKLKPALAIKLLVFLGFNLYILTIHWIYFVLFFFKKKKGLDQRVKCDTCSASFINKYALKKHIQTVHLGKPVKCTKCDKVAPNASALVIVFPFQSKSKNRKILIDFIDSNWFSIVIWKKYMLLTVINVIYVRNHLNWPSL